MKAPAALSEASGRGAGTGSGVVCEGPAYGQPESHDRHTEEIGTGSRRVAAAKTLAEHSLVVELAITAMPLCRMLDHVRVNDASGAENELPSEAYDFGPFFHGTKADLQPGDLLAPGYSSNFGAQKRANYIYLTATLDAATWGAELAMGAGPGRIYRVEPTGLFEDDPNLTDKRFPGNPTRSYRTREPL